LQAAAKVSLWHASSPKAAPKHGWASWPRLAAGKTQLA